MGLATTEGVRRTDIKDAHGPIDKRKHAAVMVLPGTPAVGTDHAARLSEVIHGAHGLFLPIRTYIRIFPESTICSRVTISRYRQHIAGLQLGTRIAAPHMSWETAN
jgi:hypothetical protein